MKIDDVVEDCVQDQEVSVATEPMNSKTHGASSYILMTNYVAILLTVWRLKVTWDARHL